MKLGAQLYTLRKSCTDLESFSETLKKVADIGYTTVQVSGTCEFEAQWLDAELRKNGLQCVLTHTAPKKLQEQLPKVCADHKVFGCQYVGLGSYGFSGDDLEAVYAKFLEIYKPVAQELKAQGLYFMYHNHAAEFQHIYGTTILRRMAEDFAPDEMGFILDTFWVQAGGANSVDYIRELKGRLPCIHLKDYQYANFTNIMDNIAAIGDGNINFEAVVNAAEDAGTKYLLVEQDACHGEDPFACMKRSYDYLHAMGLE